MFRSERTIFSRHFHSHGNRVPGRFVRRMELSPADVEVRVKTLNAAIETLRAKANGVVLHLLFLMDTELDFNIILNGDLAPG